MREIGASFAFSLIVVFTVAGACSSSGPSDAGGQAGLAGQGGSGGTAGAAGLSGGGAGGQGGGAVPGGTGGPGGAGGQGGGAGGQTINPQCSAPVPSLLVACSTYCSAVTTNCKDGDAQFTSFDDCLSPCTAPTWSCGSPGDQSGNTVLCRTWHAMAAESSPGTECPAAGPNSPVCR